MSLCVIEQAGALIATADPVGACAGFVLLGVDEYRLIAGLAAPLDLSAIGIDAASILSAFAWGFNAVVLSWAAAFAVGVAVRVIRKA